MHYHGVKDFDISHLVSVSVLLYVSKLSQLCDDMTEEWQERQTSGENSLNNSEEQEISSAKLWLF
jgi:hypothetical protein